MHSLAPLSVITGMHARLCSLIFVCSRIHEGGPILGIDMRTLFRIPELSQP